MPLPPIPITSILLIGDSVPMKEIVEAFTQTIQMNLAYYVRHYLRYLGRFI
jgi:hypothetical protein